MLCRKGTGIAFDPLSTTKQCCVCHVRKPCEEYYRDRKQPGGRQGRCKICQSTQDALKRRSSAGRAKELAGNARKRAAELGLAYDLTEAWVRARIEAGRCELTDAAFDLCPTSKFRHNPFSPSIDRIDCSRGYTMDNCRVVLTAMNLALNAFGELIFEHIAQAYLKKIAA